MVFIEKDVVEYSPKWMGAIYFSTRIHGLESQRSKQSKDFYSTWSIVKNVKSIINDYLKKGYYRRYTIHVCVLVYISKLLWTNLRLRGGKKHQYWCVWGD
jgi:hypothetical protein